MPLPHHSPLVSTIVIGLVLAFAFGAVAHRIRISPLVGYLLAGVFVGPFTPGFVADQTVANELAEIGIILLMFGVGLHFTLEDLLSVRAIAIPGAVIQVVVVTAMGAGLGWVLGWSTVAGIVFGLALAVASTVVVLRALQERRLVETERGRIAVGWLIVEDILVVLILVMLPPLAAILNAGGSASFATLAEPIASTFAKVIAFVAFMLVVGKRVIPWILHFVAHTGSRELFRLAVLAIALGVAYGSAVLFDVSFALGAFFAGMILSESALSQRAAQETLPLRDAFAVLFFVSVGMLFDPMILVNKPVAAVATLIVVVVAKAAIGYAIMRAFRYPQSTSLLIAASRAQIGEFSFILTGLGVSLAVLPQEGRDLVLAASILSLLINPLFYSAVDRLAARREREPVPEPATPDATVEQPSREPIPMTTLTDHVVLIGFGRVGSMIAPAVIDAGAPLLVVETDPDIVRPLREKGVPTIIGNSADPELIRATNLGAARCLFVAIADAFEGGQVVEQARAIAPSLHIVARAHSEAEIDHLKAHGATSIIMGEHLIAYAMIADAREAGVLAKAAAKEEPETAEPAPPLSATAS